MRSVGGRASIRMKVTKKNVLKARVLLILPPHSRVKPDCNRSQARATYHKYMHPKEVFISHGILIPDIARMKDETSLSRRRGSVRAGKPGGCGNGARRNSSPAATAPSLADDATLLSGDRTGGYDGLTFVYPYGATMTVQSPAHPVLSSGPISYPLNRPIAGVWEHHVDVVSGRSSGGNGNGQAGARGVGQGGREPRPEDHEEGRFNYLRLLPVGRSRGCSREILEAIGSRRRTSSPQRSSDTGV